MESGRATPMPRRSTKGSMLGGNVSSARLPTRISSGHTSLARLFGARGRAYTRNKPKWDYPCSRVPSRNVPEKSPKVADIASPGIFLGNSNRLPPFDSSARSSVPSSLLMRLPFSTVPCVVYVFPPPSISSYSRCRQRRATNRVRLPLLPSGPGGVCPP